MSPGQTRALFGAFLAVSVGVTANALLLQPDAQLAAAPIVNRVQATRPVVDPPMAAVVATPAENLTLTSRGAQRVGDWARTDLATRRVGGEATATQVAALPVEQTIRVGQMVLNAAKTDVMPHAPDADGDPATVRGVQRELLMRGYGPLVENGQAGPLTRAAIMAFEYDRHLALTGEATETLLRRILMDESAAVPDAASRKIKSPEAERVVRTVQHSLTTLGYQPGRIDGRVGDETEKTIRAFEAEHGLAVTGRISAELFSRLARAVGAKSTAAR